MPPLRHPNERSTRVGPAAWDWTHLPWSTTLSVGHASIKVMINAEIDVVGHGFHFVPVPSFSDLCSSDRVVAKCSVVDTTQDSTLTFVRLYRFNILSEKKPNNISKLLHTQYQQLW